MFDKTKKMRRTFIGLTTVSLSIVLLATGCKEVTDVSMEQIHKLQDSVVKIIPGITAIDVKVEKQSDLKVIIGDVSFYSADNDSKQKAAIKIGETAMLVFGADNNVKTGKLIITKENRQSSWDKDPADGVVVNMKIDSLREHDDVLLEFMSKMHK